MSDRFSPTQIVLHWLVALLVLAQFLNDSAISRAFGAMMRGGAEIAASPAVVAHIVVGVAIFAFALWRSALRLTRGAPPAVAGEPRVLRAAAKATHGLLYLLLLLLPVSGLVAWFGANGAAAGAHGALKTVLLLLVLLHVAGALYQQVVLRSGALSRMVRVRAR
jgi:cytochrome b561